MDPRCGNQGTIAFFGLKRSAGIDRSRSGDRAAERPSSLDLSGS
jgi:hypothetical protein